MKAHDFISQLQREHIVAAIREAEKKTSGEIRVFITRKKVSDPLAAAQEHFVTLGMAKTQERNGVLIFVAPRDHRFAVLGDTAVHARCGPEFWATLTAEMTGHFRRSDFTQGIVHAVAKAGDLLARHFPRRADDQNELPDEIGED